MNKKCYISPYRIEIQIGLNSIVRAPKFHQGNTKLYYTVQKLVHRTETRETRNREGRFQEPGIGAKIKTPGHWDQTQFGPRMNGPDGILAPVPKSHLAQLSWDQTGSSPSALESLFWLLIPGS